MRRAGRTARTEQWRGGDSRSEAGGDEEEELTHDEVGEPIGCSDGASGGRALGHGEELGGEQPHDRPETLSSGGYRARGEASRATTRSTLIGRMGSRWRADDEAAPGRSS